MKLQIILFTLILLSPAVAGPLSSQEYFYDGSGNNIGSAVRNNQTGQTYFYGQQGQLVGSAMPGGPRQMFFYDNAGNNIGSAQGSMFQE